MNIAYPYTAELQEDGKYLVQFIDLEEAFTEGDTLEEAAFNAAEVLTAILDCRLAHDQPIPEPSAGERVTYPQARIQAALLLRRARQEQGRTLSELARALETSWPSAQKLESPHNNPTLKQLERAAAALGKRLIVQMA
jgi:antitoxin HicB